MNIPCFNCTDRKLNCHSKCWAYKRFQNKRKILLKTKFEITESNVIFEAVRHSRFA